MCSHVDQRITDHMLRFIVEHWQEAEITHGEERLIYRFLVAKDSHCLLDWEHFERHAGLAYSSLYPQHSEQGPVCSSINVGRMDE